MRNQVKACIVATALAAYPGGGDERTAEHVGVTRPRVLAHGFDPEWDFSTVAESESVLIEVMDGELAIHIPSGTLRGCEVSEARTIVRVWM